MNKISTRLAIALPIVVFWGAMMGLLVRREVAVPHLDMASVPRLETATDNWLGLFTGQGQRVGTLHLEQRPEERHADPGVTRLLSVRMNLNLFGKPTELDLAGSAWQAYEGSQTEIEFDVRSGEYDFHLEGRILGSELRGEVHSAGEVIPLRLPVDKELIFAGGLGSALSFPRLKVGDEVRLSSFDPFTLRAKPVRVRCNAQENLEIRGETIPTQVLTVTQSGIRTRAWVDAHGQVMRAETPFGLVLEAITPEEAQAATPAAQLDDLLALTAIQPRGQRPFRGARRMIIALSHGGDGDGDDGGLTVPVDRWQTALGEGRYRLAQAEAPPFPTSGEDDPLEDPEDFLAADAFVQSGHLSIRRQAAEIVGDEGDPWAQARLLNDWVFTRLEKEAVLSIPSALEVLEKKRGDCNEHTVLFTALARAMDLPARIAIGVVWSDAYGGFYYHAWPEVHLGSWIPMDPTLGQTVADATHIKLLNGGIETWSQLLPHLGRLQVEVIEVE